MKKQQTKLIPFVLRMDQQLYDDIREQAAKEERSIANFVRKVLRDYITKVKRRKQ